MKYIYETITIKYNIFSGRSEDYLQIINDKGAEGWRFVCFANANYKPKGVKGIELIFEKQVGS